MKQIELIFLEDESPTLNFSEMINHQFKKMRQKVTFLQCHITAKIGLLSSRSLNVS